MRVIDTVADLKAVIRMQKKTGKSIGLVPTMGYLHEGHMSLVKTSIHDNDFTVISIFVNPTQFGPNEDYSKYPRSLEKDSQMAEAAGADIIFSPSASEMYPEEYSTFVSVEGITEKMCGKSRPGHFRGVTTVVLKLLNIVEPDNAYFGQKDAQQAAVIKRMTKDLNMNPKIIMCPIVREQDGLAMSSRNIYLNTEERKAALVLSKSLFEAENKIKNGERRKDKIIETINKSISQEKLAGIDYVTIVNADTLNEISIIDQKVLVALAVKIGATRLIDNVIVEVQ